jgi:lipid-A-disaccharide synthase
MISDTVPRQPLRVGIVVGEASGDILGAGLMRSLRQRYPDAVFEGIGGERMLALGFTSFFAQERLAVMGLVEPLKRLPELLRIRKTLIRHFIQNPPDVFIGIDSPDFTLTIEERLKQAGIKTVHYVSPSVWAWRQRRIVKIARAVDLMLTLLPFEADFYRQHQVPVEFVGHPLADEIGLSTDRDAARRELGLVAAGPLLALMPGSRGGEVKLLGPLFWETARQCQRAVPTMTFIVPAANAARRAQIVAQLQDYPDLPVTLVDGRSHTVMAAADAVLMASGTTTLEALLLKRPMVVAYKLAWLSFAIISRMVKTPFFSLPNLLAGRQLVPELLQEAATPANLAQQVLRYFDGSPVAAAQVAEFLAIHLQLRRDASDRAARAIITLLEP